MQQTVRRSECRWFRRATVPLLAAVLIAGACAAKDADQAAKKDGSSAAVSTTTAAEATKFGTLTSPCGHGSATIQADQAGGSPDKIRIGVANDREGLRPGLFKEVWDASTAFVAWCNDQGGIDGLQLEAVDLDGKVFEIEPAMATACTGVFALVGGGWGQDDLMFTGKDGSDFHKCKLMAFPGFAVSPDFAEASDQVPASPNPAHVKDASYFTALARLYPEQAKEFGVVYSNVPSVTRNKDQQIGMAKQIDGFGGYAEIAYDVVNQDWSVLAQQVIDKGLQLVSFNGESPSMALFSQALKDQGWGGVLIADANQYDSRLSESSGPAAVDGVVVRFAAHTFEEQDQWPAVKQMTGILDAKVPGWQHAGLAIQSFSANLLFATAVKSCADTGPITRQCVLKAGLAVHEWDGGGLLSATDPGTNTPSTCSMLLQVKDGKYERLFPKLKSKDDDGEGFYCTQNITLEGDFGKGNTDSSILG